MFSAGLLVLVAWGALAFGAEYAWAFAPLLSFAIVVAWLASIEARQEQFPSRALLVAFSVVIMAAVLQITPLPGRVAAAVAPGSDSTAFVQMYRAALMAAPERSRSVASAWRTLSILPSRTELGIAFVTALLLLMVAATRAFARVGANEITRALVVIGCIVALIQLAQAASSSDVVYGLWYPPALKGYHSAPFVNRNHTAGWLLMAFALAAGRFAAALATIAGAKISWRDRVLWFGSPQAGELLLTAFACGLMAIAIVSTSSRSGSFCLGGVIILLAAWMLFRLKTLSSRTTAAVLVAGIGLVVFSLNATEIVARRVRGTVWGNLDGRLDLWRDTVNVIRHFPLTGTGLNTFGIAMLRYQTVHDGFGYIEAHNDYLQVAAEGGLLLGLPIVAALGLFAREVWMRFQEKQDDSATYWLRAGAVVGLIGIALQESFDFTLQMPGAAVFFVCLASVAMHRPSHTTRGLHTATACDGV